MPARFDESSFYEPFTGAAASGAALGAVAMAAINGSNHTDAYIDCDGMPDQLVDPFAARFTAVRDRSLLGACKDTHWPRLCSFWVSLHLMAYRADALQVGAEFLRTLVPALSGGGLFCKGCTLHFRLLNRPALSAAILRDEGSYF